MKIETIQTHWRHLVTVTAAQQRTDEASVWGLVAKLYPAQAVLLKAAGARRDQVIAFCNSQLRLTPEGRQQFANEVRDEAKRTGGMPSIIHDRKLNQRLASLPFVSVRMPGMGNNRMREFANEATAATTPGADGVPVLGPQLAAIFKIRVATQPDAWAAIWKANQSRTYPVNFGNTFDALCQWYIAKNGGGYDDAISKVQKLFPDIWSACESLAAM